MGPTQTVRACFSQGAGCLQQLLPKSFWFVTAVQSGLVLLLLDAASISLVVLHYLLSALVEVDGASDDVVHRGRLSWSETSSLRQNWGTSAHLGAKGPIIGTRKGTGTGELGPARPKLTRIQTSETGYG